MDLFFLQSEDLVKTLKIKMDAVKKHYFAKRLQDAKSNKVSLTLTDEGNAQASRNGLKLLLIRGL